MLHLLIAKDVEKSMHCYPSSIMKENLSELEAHCHLIAVAALKMH